MLHFGYGQWIAVLPATGAGAFVVGTVYFGLAAIADSRVVDVETAAAVEHLLVAEAPYYSHSFGSVCSGYTRGRYSVPLG